MLICGSGIGMSIAANKFRGVRASMVTDAYAARLTRRNNDSNILCLGGRMSGRWQILEIVDVWLNTAYDAGHHEDSLKLIAEMEDAMLRDRFMNCAQALVHGDLHSRSIFANADGLKVLDPEFAFYGPMGYAGTEIIRRVVGDSKVMEVTSVKEADKRIPMERALIKIGKAFIMQRETISTGREIVEMFRAVIAE